MEALPDLTNFAAAERKPPWRTAHLRVKYMRMTKPASNCENAHRTSISVRSRVRG
jgi:hypothetical protein